MREREEPLSTADVAAAGERESLRSDPRERGNTEPPDVRMRDVEVDPRGPVDERRAGESDENQPLFSENDWSELRARWEDIQSAFVDEPRRAVERADELVAEVMHRLAQSFANERSQLESQWAVGDDVSTEDLRLALRRYRSFFGRLLSV